VSSQLPLVPNDSSDPACSAVAKVAKKKENSKMAQTGDILRDG
jgi:hypothetical protein